MPVQLKHAIVPNLWFDGTAEEAAAFYCDVFPDSRIVTVNRYTEAGPGEPGSAMVVEWEINGQRFMGINGGSQFTFSGAVSFLVTCQTQDEIDYYWDRLREGGGEEGQCGWLTDRFGVFWQVAPEGMDELFADPDQRRATRAMQAMFGMKRLDIAALRAAADGDSDDVRPAPSGPEDQPASRDEQLNPA